ADIQAFAFAMIPQLHILPKEFKASQHRIGNFLQGYELPLRRLTTMVKLEDNEVIKHALAFKSFVYGINFIKPLNWEHIVLQKMETQEIQGLKA
ncbi:hypothetical protein AVEN_17911-1, partial [Araneus ventricosus]